MFLSLRRWFRQSTPARSRSRFRPLCESLEARRLLAAPVSWESRGSGGGGALYSPSFGRQDPSEMYIASDMGQIFHSGNQGAGWDTVNHTEIQGNRGARVQFTDNNLIRYAIDYTVVDGLDLARPSKTTDGGVTWTPLAADPTGGEAYSLYVDPHNPNTVFVSDYAAAYLSTDGGASFSQKFSTSDSNTGLHVGGAFFDGANIYVGTGKGLYVSTNGGASFAASSITGIPATEAIVSLAGAKQNGVVRLMAVTLGSGDVYAGITGDDYFGYQGVYRLEVGNGSWVRQTAGIAAGNYPFFVAMAENNIDVAYVAGGSDPEAPIVFKTTNGGASWQSVLLTTNNQNVATGWAGQNGDRGWSYGGWTTGFAVAPTDPNRIVVTDYGFAHVSTTGGTSWQAAYVNPSDLNPAGAATPKGKAYHSSGLDNTTGWGVTWADASHLISSNSDIRGQISADGGQSWSFNYTGHTLNSMYRSVKHPTTGVLYAATGSVHDMYQSTYLTDARIDGGAGQVLFSANQGATWQVLHDFGHNVIWVATDPTNPNRLYASVIHSSQGGIYVSNNIQNGAASTWTKLANPPRTEGHPFNIVVLNDGSIVASYSARRNSAGAFTASSGVFLSTDGGATWQDRSATGMRYWTKDIVVDANDPTQSTWYAGVWSGWGGPPNGLGGLYKTTNRGQSWTRINSLDRVTSLTIDPTNPNEAYLTTEVDGLWYTQNLNSATPTFTQLTAYPFRQPERVFFNPFDSGEVWVTSFGGGLRVGRTSANSAGSFQFNTSSYSVNENGATATITVQRVGGSAGSVSVSYATSNGTATAGQDYTAAAGTLTFANGVTSQTFTIPITNDATFEGNETVALTLSSPTGGATLGSPTTATLTIVDDDAAPQPGQFRFSATSYSLGEAGGAAVITVQRVNGSDGAVSVAYATSNGTATAGSDYTTASGILSFAAGEVSKTFSVVILNDTSVEGNETVQLTLSNATGGATLGSPSTATLIINDDDVAQPGQLRFSATSYSIGEAGGSVVITVQRVNGSDGAVSVAYATSNGTATAGSDYTATSGVLSFTAGETSKTFSVPVLNDTAVEGNETVQLTLSNATGGATLATPATATLTINDDDVAQPGQFRFSLASYTIGEAGGSAVITVQRINGSDGAVAVAYATSDGTATAGADFTATSGVLNFAAGETSKTFSVAILNDTSVEGNETVQLTLSNTTGGATLGSPSAATLTITDDDVAQPGQLRFSATSYTIGESGGSVVITVQRVNGSDGAVSIAYATSNGTATAGSDYTAASGVLNFAAGETSKTFSVAVLNDPTVEGNETVQLTLSNATGGATLGSPATAVLTITDDDVAPQPGQFRFSVTSYTVTEGLATAIITVQRVNGSDGAASVAYATANGTATAGQDYTATSGVLNFAAGETSKTFTVSILNDTTAESNETVALTLSNPTGGATLGSPATATLTIADDDAVAGPGRFRFTSPTWSVKENAGTITLTVERIGGNTGKATVQYQTVDLTGPGINTAWGEGDYRYKSGTLTFLTGETQKTITITIINDKQVELSEVFGVQLRSPTGGATLDQPANAVVTILEDDSAIQYSTGKYYVTEGVATVLITVVRLGNTEGTASVDYKASGETAYKNEDFVPVKGTLTFNPGETSKTFEIPIIDDQVVEAVEQLVLNLTNPTGGAQLGTEIWSRVFITDND